MVYCTRICIWAPPPLRAPRFHIRHSRDKCSQAFPVFRALLPSCIILNANRRTKNGVVLAISLERSLMKSSTLFEVGHRPLYVHLASTRRHSRDKCSQAFHVFRALPPQYNILNANRRTKKRDRPRNENPHSGANCIF